jgi:prepilin-type N-terminal cleavage/methylation domain-containing protein
MRAHAIPRARCAERGFTILEVMVALSAGVLVSMATFMMSKSASAFFQREARVSSAQLALTLAMNRITGDIQRASFLSTPNIQTDPNICRQTVSGTWPVGLSLLGGVYISTSPFVTPQSALQAPPLAPDQITIGGSMDSVDVYQVQSVINGAGGAPLLVMRLPTADPASYRTIAQQGATGVTLQTALTPVFYPSTYPVASVSSGRFGHIYQPEGNNNWYGVIDTFTTDPVSGALKVQMRQTPTIPIKPGNTCGIGLGDTGGGWVFSVVSRVQYSIQSMTGYPANQYTQITSPPTDVNQAKQTGDSGRTELLRVELDANNNPLPGAVELVAEYAVDLRFGITVSTEVQNNNYNPTVTSYPFGNANVYSLANDIAHGGLPQRIRAVQLRLSTRTRAPDSAAALPVGPDGRILRFLIDPSLQPAYARVRTNYANVALPNQGGFSLW